MGNGIFSNCASFVSITINSGIINDSFRDCTSLRSLILGENVTKIGNNAFMSCTGLQSIDFSPNVKEIGGYAFSGCTSMTNITFVEKTEKICESSFSGCTAINTINFSETGSLIIESSAFSECTVLKTIMLPKSLTNIEYAVFYNCQYLERINYRGMSNQWKNITKANKWYDGGGVTYAAYNVKD